MGKWEIEPHTNLDKRFRITTGGELALYVDYDDVDREQVDREAEALVNAMNGGTPLLHDERMQVWLEGFKLGKATSRVALEQFFTTMRANSVPDKEAVDMLFQIYERFGGLSDA